MKGRVTNGEGDEEEIKVLEEVHDKIEKVDNVADREDRRENQFL